MTAKCSVCGLDWQISIKTHIPKSGYICPHCTYNRRHPPTAADKPIKRKKGAST